MKTGQRRGSLSRFFVGEVTWLPRLRGGAGIELSLIVRICSLFCSKTPNLIEERKQGSRGDTGARRKSGRVDQGRLLHHASESISRRPAIRRILMEASVGAHRGRVDRSG